MKTTFALIGFCLVAAMDLAAQPCYFSTPATLAPNPCTNVGIGTQSPTSIQSNGPVLHLYGQGPSLRIQDTASGGDWNIFARNGGSANLFRIYDNAHNADRLSIDGAGHVGIGTTSPLSGLDVSDGTRHTWLQPRTAESGTGLKTGIDLASYGAYKLNLAGDIAGGGTSGGVSLSYYNASTGIWNSAVDIKNAAGVGNLLLMQDGGNVGIGTASPASIQSAGPALHLYGAGPSLRIQDSASGGDWNLFARTGSTTNLFRIYDNAHSADRLTIDASGNVGIGVALTVGPAGGTGTKLTVNGDVTVTGNLAAKFQDIAEWVPVTESMTEGTVVVVSNDASNSVSPSRHAYDTGVAGVISAQPGLTLGEGSASKAKVATTGRVKVHVDASTHRIARGDLLVTSEKPGTAMFSEALDLGGVKIHRPGTLIGKALEPLDKGQGEILVLLSLQ